jgi:membrane protease YdiL (CAAX protease family)
MRRDQLLWLAVAFEGGLFLLAAGAAWLLGLPLRSMATWDWSHVGWALAATAPPVATFWWLQHSRLPPLRRFREAVDRLVTPLFDDCTWLDFAVISLVAGVGEECLFRAVLQSGLAPWVGTVAAILIAGAIFGLVHWITPMYAFYATVMGIYLGFLLVYFDNLLVPMIVHGLYDFVALAWVTGDSGSSAGAGKADDETTAEQAADERTSDADQADNQTVPPLGD